MLESLCHPNITQFIGVCSKPVAIMMDYECFDFSPFGVNHQISNLLQFLNTLDRIEGETEAFEHFLLLSFSTLRIFHTPRIPHSSFSTLRTFHTPHFPHSALSTLRTFHTPHFPHSALRTPRFPPNPLLRHSGRRRAWTDSRTNRQTEGWMDERTDGRTERRMSGYTDKMKPPHRHTDKRRQIRRKYNFT